MFAPTMTRPLAFPSSRPAADAGDRYLRLLCYALLGYALLGKGFAYVGVPPVYVGELLLFMGLLAVAAGRRLGTAARCGPVLALGLFMAWGAARTLPFVGAYGVVALRDGAVWGYGLFAVVVAALLIESPARLRYLVRMFSRFVPTFLVLAPVLFLFLEFAGDRVPTYPGSGVPILGVNKGGDHAVHLAGAFAFLCLFEVERRAWWYVMLLVDGLVINLTGRAAMLAFLVGAGIVTAARPLAKNGLRLWGLLALALVVLWGTKFSLSYPGMGRDISFNQLVDNVQSIVGNSDRDELAGSKEWRLEWWHTIVGYTLHGKYFWTGKGFGINLADDDGFQVSGDDSLRSPHNGHLTILARAGVPGLRACGLAQAVWAFCMVDGWYARPRPGGGSGRGCSCCCWRTGPRS